eukprot:3154927-Amphidinium_carterae.1
MVCTLGVEPFPRMEFGLANRKACHFDIMHIGGISFAQGAYSQDNPPNKFFDNVAEIVVFIGNWFGIGLVMNMGRAVHLVPDIPSQTIGAIPRIVFGVSADDFESGIRYQEVHPYTAACRPDALVTLLIILFVL